MVKGVGLCRSRVSLAQPTSPAQSGWITPRLEESCGLAMVETALPTSLKLTPRLELQLARRLQGQQREDHWHGRLPVLLLDRCWLQLQEVPVERLAAHLPPDCTAAAPELAAFRHWCRQGLSPEAAEAHCWQEFGQEACGLALKRHWQAQERGHGGWTLTTYLDFLSRYRRCFAAAGPRPLPLLVMARIGSGEPHRLLWLVAPGTLDAAHLPPD